MKDVKHYPINNEHANFFKGVLFAVGFSLLFYTGLLFLFT